MGEVTVNVKNEASEIIGQHENLPRLVVFDLDYTLWPFYCECCYEDETPYLYAHCKGILEAMKEKGIDVAVASRSPTPDIARTFLRKLGIYSIFVAVEIFSSWTHKTEHFHKIHQKTGVPFSSMLFFDDEDRNIEAVSKMGVTSILVDNGVNLDALRQGLSEYSQKSGSFGRSWGGINYIINPITVVWRPCCYCLRDQNIIQRLWCQMRAGPPQSLLSITNNHPHCILNIPLFEKYDQIECCNSNTLYFIAVQFGAIKLYPHVFLMEEKLLNEVILLQKLVEQNSL